MGAWQAQYVALFCAVLWAIGNVLLTPVANREGALRVVGVQAALASLAFLVLVRFLGGWQDLRSLDWRTAALFFCAAGPLSGGGSALFFGAVREIGIARTFPISSSYPLLTTLAAVLFLREQPTSWVVGGTLALLAGLGLISYSRMASDAVPTLQRPLFRYRGFWYAILAAVLWAASTFVVKVGLTQGIHPLLANLLRMPGVVVMVVLVLSLRREGRPLWAIRRISWRSLVVATLLGQVVGDGLYLWALQSSAASVVVPLATTSPLWTIPMAYFFLRERLNWTVVAGILLSVLGIGAIVA